MDLLTVVQLSMPWRESWQKPSKSSMRCSSKHQTLWRQRLPSLRSKLKIWSLNLSWKRPKWATKFTQMPRRFSRKLATTKTVSSRRPKKLSTKTSNRAVTNKLKVARWTSARDYCVAVLIFFEILLLLYFQFFRTWFIKEAYQKYNFILYLQAKTPFFRKLL